MWGKLRNKDSFLSYTVTSLPAVIPLGASSDRACLSVCESESSMLEFLFKGANMPGYSKVSLYSLPERTFKVD